MVTCPKHPLFEGEIFHGLSTPPSSLVHGDGVELLEAGEGLRAEGLVDLELVDVGEGLSGLGHHGADGGHGPDTHDLGVAPGDAVPDDPEGGWICF